MSVQTVAAPTPLNNNLARALFVWTANDGSSNDVLSTDAKIQALLDHCATYGVNVLFFGIYPYIGLSSWTGVRAQRLQLLLERCHQSGIQVHALAGDVGWGTAHKWVVENILLPLRRYQDMSTAQQRFDGVCLDVEYWTDEGTYPASTNLPGLLTLVRKFRDVLGVAVGCFTTFWLKDSTETRADVSFMGKAAQDGEHFMDYCDYVVVGCYYENSTGQIDRFQPWYDYAKDTVQPGRNVGLYCGSECQDGLSPETLSYWEEGRAAMETAHASVSSQFYVNADSVFLGQAIHDYEHHASMSS